jgi:ribonuclease Y
MEENMSDIVLAVIVALVASAGSFGAFYLMSGKKNAASEKSEETQVNVSKEAVVMEARVRAKEIIVEAKDQAFKTKQESQKESTKIKSEALEAEKKISIREVELESKEKQLKSQKQSMEGTKQHLERKRAELDKSVKEQQGKLEKIVGLSKKEAKNQLLASFDRELQQEKGKKVRELEEEIKKTADEKAREIVVSAIRQGATDYVVEHSSSKVKLPDEDMKGRIIGKEGRNIRKFEELTGVELELDATPGEIMISSFDPVRREVARASVEKLL